MSIKKIEEYAIIFCILMITAVMNANVVMRYVFNQSWTPTEEVCLILVVIVTFIGSAHAVRIGMHLFASILFDLPFLSAKTKKFLAVFISAACALLCVVIVYVGCQLVMATKTSGRTTPSLGIPFYLFYAVLPIGFSLMFCQYSVNIYKNLTGAGYSLSPEKGDEQ